MKTCIKCGATEVKQWFTGPCCGVCYRKNRHLICIYCEENKSRTWHFGPTCWKCLHYIHSMIRNFKKHSSADRVKRHNALKRSAFTKERFTSLEIYKRDNHTCWICLRKLKPEEESLDHVIPLSKGGNHTKENVRCACRSCNSWKCDHILTEEQLQQRSVHAENVRSGFTKTSNSERKALEILDGIKNG